MNDFLPLIIEHDGAPLTGLTSAGEPQRALTAPQGDLFSREAGVFMAALVMALVSGERVLIPRDMPIEEEPPNTIGDYTDVLVHVNTVSYSGQPNGDKDRAH